MIRRRRHAREIPFSFDSFLDIVANVLGIIIRLILVVWVGARSYSSLSSEDLSNGTSGEQPLVSIPVIDPLEQELAASRVALAEAQNRLLAQLRELETVKGEADHSRTRLADLKAAMDNVTARQSQLSGDAEASIQEAKTAAIRIEEIRARASMLAKEIRALESQPLQRQVLRYRTPVSQPLQSDEVFFECTLGRVTLIDVPAMLLDARDALAERANELKSRWLLTGTSRQVGAFRLRYTIERQRGALEGLAGDRAAPDPNSGFSYGLTAWQVEPVDFNRGETLIQALRAGSQFRQAVDQIDPQFTAITFWITPDSFELFRQLRDFLYDRDIVVAGRPLPEGFPIASSSKGTASRGQ